MERVVEACDELNLTKSDVLLELDFLPDDDSGYVPALDTPLPFFEVKASRGYFEGERVNEPDWFFKHEDEETYKKNIANIVPGIKDHFERMTENHLLFLVRQLGGFTSCYRLQMTPGEGIETQMFGEDAFQAFQSVVNEKDYGPLASVFDETVVTRARGYFTETEAGMDGLRQMLNALGGDFARGA